MSPSSTRRYLDLLTGALMLRQLQPWHANLKRRQDKSPKVYVRDSGLLHQSAGAREREGAAQPSEAGRLVGGLRHRAGPGERAT